MNTEVGVKEMVHRIFKNMVPHTNRKNVELDLLKQYTTLQSIRYLADGGIDARYLQPSIGFANIFHDTNCLFKDWFITKGSLESNDEDLEESESNYLSFLFLILDYILRYYIKLLTIFIVTSQSSDI